MNFNEAWVEMTTKALGVAKLLDPKYLKRLEFEIQEIEKQEATPHWARLYNENHKYNTNKNGLVLPWALKMTDVDPIGDDVVAMIGDDNGKVGDAIVIELEDREIILSQHTLVLVGDKWVAAKDLAPGMDIN